MVSSKRTESPFITLFSQFFKPCCFPSPIFRIGRGHTVEFTLELVAALRRELELGAQEVFRALGADVFPGANGRFWGWVKI